MDSNTIKLTQFSPAAGCGCKLSPETLREILTPVEVDALEDSTSPLLVGNSSRDDAAAVDIGGGRALLSTTDFFTPIVDDPFEFGQISATNAISDIYAMGGHPTVAIAILGWPVDKLAPAIASRVLAGARQTCREAGIALAGGHSIDISEPIFGLAVSGLVDIERLKQNNTAQKGDTLFLTKPLGVGIISTAIKRGKAQASDVELASQSMRLLNRIGPSLAEINGVNALTDVTGFGLAGHLTEIMTASALDADINWSQIPTLPNLEYYVEEECVPGGTGRNYTSIKKHLPPLNPTQRAILCDPQTSGGLLVTAQPEAVDHVSKVLKDAGLPFSPIGRLNKQVNEQASLKLSD
jgi:selenide,water dikinase